VEIKILSTHLLVLLKIKMKAILFEVTLVLYKVVQITWVGPSLTIVQLIKPNNIMLRFTLLALKKFVLRYSRSNYGFKVIRFLEKISSVFQYC